MNILLFYPRLLVALLVRPLPTTLPALQHWVYAQIFFLWNEPWHDESDTLGMEAVRHWHQREERCDPTDPAVKRTAMWLRVGYLIVLFYWPFFALLIALSKKNRRLSHWIGLVNKMTLVFEDPQDDDWQHATTFSGLSLYIPLLYLASKTGERLPDLKNQIHDHCRAWGIPTPWVFTAAAHPLPAGSFVIKPVAGCRAKGLIFTADPMPYVNDRRVVVQEVMRNCPELRRMWGTDALGTVRLMTLATGGRYELACSLLRIPIGDSRIDNACHGNAFALVDRGGRLSRVYRKCDGTTGVPCHPTTGVTIEGAVIPRFEECVELALTAHQRLAPHAPYFNSDIAPTDQGPMLIEINNMPGLPTLLFDDCLTTKFVDATRAALERATRRGLQENARAIGQWSSPASDGALRYPRAAVSAS